MEIESASAIAMRHLLQTQGVDAVLAAAAGVQHGIVGRRQLLSWGVDAGAIARRVRAARLHVTWPGVYAVGHAALTWEGRWMTAVLACEGGREEKANAVGPVLSHRAAAALWGIRGYSGTTVDVTLPSKSRSRGWIRRHYSLLPPDEVTVERGIPVTTVPRTIFDLTATEPAEAIESMLREAEFLRLYDKLSLPALLARYPGRRGTRAVRACLARREADPASGEEPTPERIRSLLEERFLPFLDRHRLPRPRFNAHLEAGGRWHEVDCLWLPQREIVELDGWEGHGTRDAFRNDRARDRRLRLAGYGITRLTWSQLDDEQDTIAADLRALLTASRMPSRHRNHT